MSLTSFQNNLALNEIGFNMESFLNKIGNGPIAEKMGGDSKCFYKTDLSALYPIKCFVTIVQNKNHFPPKIQKRTSFSGRSGARRKQIGDFTGNATTNPRLFFLLDGCN